MIIMVAWRLGPAFADVGAGRLLADGVQIVGPHHLAGGGIFVGTGALTRIQSGLRRISCPGGAPFRDGVPGTMRVDHTVMAQI